MKKFFLTIIVCLAILTNIANAKGSFKDDDGFSYIISPSYLVYGFGNRYCSVYDLDSIKIIADNDSRFEFNVTGFLVSYNDESISEKRLINIYEDYGTGKIYEDGKLLEGQAFNCGKTMREIYFKMKSVALSK